MPIGEPILANLEDWISDGIDNDLDSQSSQSVSQSIDRFKGNQNITLKHLFTLHVYRRRETLCSIAKCFVFCFHQRRESVVSLEPKCT